MREKFVKEKKHKIVLSPEDVTVSSDNQLPEVLESENENILFQSEPSKVQFQSQIQEEYSKIEPLLSGASMIIPVTHYVIDYFVQKKRLVQI